VQLLDGELMVSPSDLTRFVACRHLTALDLRVAHGELAAPAPPSTDGPPTGLAAALAARGHEHELRYLQKLRGAGLQVVEIELGPNPGTAQLRAAEQATVAAMSAGADVIYQAVLLDPGPAAGGDPSMAGPWRGQADFLIRRSGSRLDARSGRWAWWYDVADCKLGRRVSPDALVQTAGYATRLGLLQGVPPELLVVVTGDGQEHEFPYRQWAAHAQLLRGQLRAFVDDPPTTRPEPVSHCGRCRWRTRCREQWQEEDHLSQVAALHAVQAQALRAAGIDTLAALAGADPGQLQEVLGVESAERLVHQARLQLSERRTGRPAHRVLPAVPGRGLALLPRPSPGDVFFDMEGDPFVGERGLEYLFGVVQGGVYTGYWATDPAREQGAFEQLVDRLVAVCAADPQAHVYHYAPYEPTRMTALARHHRTRVAEVDELIALGRLVDLYVVVRQGIQIGKSSYSLKQLEDHYWGHGRGNAAVTDAMGSVEAFERWRREGDDELLEGIRAYNEEDCRSTEALRDWLEGLRREAGGEACFGRPEPAEPSRRAG